MNIVPKQVEVDEAVITYWLKKLHWKDEEFASLCCGINPIAYEAFTLSFFKAVDFEIQPSKVQDIKDICRLIHDRLEFIDRTPGPPQKWKALASKLELTLPEWFSRVPELSPTTEEPSHLSATPPITKKIQLGVTTSELAAAFDGLKWTRAKWQHYLGKPPLWLKSSQMSKGLQGRQSGGVWKESSWNPVTIASELASKDIPIRRISKAFSTSPAMRAWIEDWEEYRATYHPNE